MSGPADGADRERTIPQSLRNVAPLLDAAGPDSRREAALDGIDAAVCLLDESGRVVELNLRWRNELQSGGLGSECLAELGADYPAHLEAVVGGNGTLRRFAGGVRAVVAGRRDFAEDEVALGPPGERRWWLVVARRIDEGRAGRTMVAHYEVTGVHRATDAAAAAEIRFRATIEAVSEGIIVVDSGSAIVDMNAAAERISGVPREVAIGTRTAEWEFREPDGSLRLPDNGAVEEALCTGQPTYEPLLGFRRPDGRRIWVELRAAPIFLGPDDRPSHAVVTFVDVTERRRTEELRRALSTIGRQVTGRLELGEILETVCRGVVGLGMRLAWIGLAREDGSIEISPRARAGEAVGYLDGLELRWDGGPETGATAGTAIRTGEITFVDVEADDRFARWRAPARAHRLRTCLGVPLRSGDRIIGALCAYADRPGVFDPALVEMLTALAEQAAVAIQAAQAHGALAKSEARYRTILETTREGVWLVDANAVTTYVNRRMADMLGYTVEEMVRRPVFDFMNEPARAVAERDIERRKRGIAEEEELPLRRKDGSEVWVLLSIAPIMDDAGRYTGALATVTDVTARRDAEKMIRRVMLAIEQASDAICITDTSGIIEYVNPAFCAHSGYSAEELAGKTPAILKSGKQDASFYQNLWETIVDGRTWSGVLTNRRKDGTLYHEATVIAPVRADGRVVNFVAVKRDVTHELVLEAQLRQAQKLEAIGQLAGGVAHDFNNALTGVIGFAELTLEELARDDPLRANLDEIRRSAERAAAIARQLLIFSRQHPVELHVVDINATVERLAKMLRRLLGDEITLSLALAPGLDPVRADEGQIEQVITNLCVNARDAMPQGGRIVISTTSVECAPPATRGTDPEPAPAVHVVLSVTDTGTGMTPEVRARIFEPFFTTKPKGKGTGLGLAVVHGIVSTHRGWIDVDTEPGRGTTMMVFLPRSEGQVAGRSPAAANEALPRGAGETVLIADDEEIVRMTVASVLERLGYRTLVASNGYEAIGLAERHEGTIDLLVSDVSMPGLGGPALAADLEARRPGLRTLFISGYREDTDEAQRIPAGAAFLEKPFSATTIARSVREILDRPIN